MTSLEPRPINSLEARRHAERTAALCFAVGTLMVAIVCGAIIVSGWFAGVIDDRYERVFWLGALLAIAMIAVLAAAVFPGGADDARVTRRVTTLTRVSLVLLVLAPVLCLGSLVADFFY